MKRRISPFEREYMNLAVKPDVWKEVKQMAMDSEKSVGTFIKDIIREKKQKKDGPFFKI